MLWGCLQMMTVTPVMSSSSSTATAVSTGSPENTCLGHWARIRLRMVSRRTAGSRWRGTGWTPEDKDAGTLGHTHLKTAYLRKGHLISKIPPQLPQTHRPPHTAKFRIQPKRNPTAHQAGRHIHRQSTQISEWGQCWRGTTESSESLNFLLQVQIVKVLLPTEKYLFRLLLSHSGLNSVLVDT